MSSDAIVFDPVAQVCENLGRAFLQERDRAERAERQVEQLREALDLAESAVLYAREVLVEDGYVKNVRHIDGILGSYHRILTFADEPEQ